MSKCVSPRRRRPLRIIELMDAEGPFLRANVRPATEPVEPPAPPEDVTGDGGVLEEVQAHQREAQARNEALTREVSELTVRQSYRTLGTAVCLITGVG